MKVLGRNIGTGVDQLYEEVEARTREEAERELCLRDFEGVAFANVPWTRGEVRVSIHKGLPTHAIPHVLAIALQHVRQRLDLYPDVHRPFQTGSQEAGLVRTGLRELVLAPEAEQQLAALDIDTGWEIKQRHEGMKAVLRDVPKDWDKPSRLAGKFASLQLARLELEHPPKLWKGLRKHLLDVMPKTTAKGAELAAAVKQTGWGSQDACLASLVTARDLLRLKKEAVIGDRRSGETL